MKVVSNPSLLHPDRLGLWKAVFFNLKESEPKPGSLYPKDGPHRFTYLKDP